MNHLKELEKSRSYQQIINDQPINQKFIVESEHIGEYNSAFKNINTTISKQKLYEKLRESYIQYDQKQFSKDININVIHHTNQYRIVTLHISLYNFIFEIKLLNLDFQSKFSTRNKDFSLMPIGSGQFGQTFACRFSQNDDTFAIKHLQYKFIKQILYKQNLQLKLKSQLKNALRQFCFCKLFSALQIGPYIQSNLGFDLLIYNDCIEFAMEICQRKFRQQCNTDLLQSLNLMHYLNFIHGDIKPANIMYSKKYEKNIFIDFGLTQFNSQKIGNKTFLTSYFGTLNYSTNQMAQIITGKSKYIDLYYNDLFGLNKSLSVINNTNNLQTKIELSYPNSSHLNILLNIKFMSLIYKVQLKNIKQFIKKYKNFVIEQTTLKLILQLEYNYTLQNIIETLLQNFNIVLNFEDQLNQFIKRKQKYLKKNINSQLKQRMENLSVKIVDYQTQITMLTKFLTQYDTSRSSILKKQQLLNNIKTINYHEKGFWVNLCKYIINYYISSQQYIQIINLTKLKCNMLNMNNINNIQNFKTQIITNIYQISQWALNSDFVNLFQLSKVFYDYYQQKYIKQRIIERYHSKQVLKNFGLLQKILLQQVQYFAPYSKQMLRIIFEKEKMEYSGQSRFQIYAFQKNQLVILCDSQKYFYLKTRSMIQNCQNNQTKQIYFIQKFYKSETGKKTLLFAIMEYFDIFRQAKGIRQTFLKIKTFFENKANLCFTQQLYIFYQQFILIQKILRKKQQKQIKIKQQIIKIIRNYKKLFPTSIILNFIFSIIRILRIFNFQFLLSNSNEILQIIIQQTQIPILIFEQNKKKLIIQILLNQSSSIIHMYISLYEVLQKMPIVKINKKIFEYVQKVTLNFDIKKSLNENDMTKEYKHNFEKKYIQDMEMQFLYNIIIIQNKYSLINEITFYDYIKKFIKKYENKFTKISYIKKYQILITKSIQLSLQRNQQYPQIQLNILKNYINMCLSFDQLKIFLQVQIGLALSKCCQHKYYEQQLDSSFIQQFWNLCIKLLLRSKNKKYKNINYIYYGYIKLICSEAIKPIEQSEQNYHKIGSHLYNFIIKLYKSNEIDFSLKYPNIILIIELFLTISIQNYQILSKINKNFIMQLENLLKIAKTCLNNSDYYFLRSFNSNMNYWMLQLSDKRIIKLEKYKINTKKYIKIYFNGIRNHQYIIPQIFMNKFFDILLKKLENAQSNKTKQVKLIKTNLLSKINKIIQNKSQKGNCKSFQLVLTYFQQLYCKQLNKQNPSLFSHFEFNDNYKLWI